MWRLFLGVSQFGDVWALVKACTIRRKRLGAVQDSKRFYFFTNSNWAAGGEVQPEVAVGLKWQPLLLNKP